MGSIGACGRGVRMGPTRAHCGGAGGHARGGDALMGSVGACGRGGRGGALRWGRWPRRDDALTAAGDSAGAAALSALGGAEAGMFL